jgi:hypothetical protein
MGSQAIEAASQERKPVEGSRVTSRAAARASAVGTCILWLFTGAAEDGLCSEGTIRAQAFTAPTEKGREVSGPYAIRNESLLVSLVAETMAVERQILERGRETIDNPAGRLTLVQRSDAAQGTAVQAPEPAPASEREQALEQEQERDRVEALARTLTSSLRAELNAVQSAAEAARIKQRQEQDRADTLARELATLRAELDTARFIGKEAAQAIEVGIRQTQALEQERDRANNLARELTFLRAELDVTRIAVSKAVQAAEAEVKQEQALEQERGRADNLARELAALRAELDTARIPASETAKATAAEIEQKQALERERARAENLARELATLRAELDTARIPASETAKATAAEIEQKQALERERARADALARDLTSLRAELDTARIAASDAAKATAAEIEQKQALEPKLKQQGDRAEALARELTSVRAELDAARAATPEAAQIVEAAKIEQKRALEKERDKTETLARELASAQKQADERSKRLAAAHAEVLQVTETNRAIAAEQKLALARERERADALAQELASVRKQLEAANRQFAALTASRALTSREPAVDSPLERVAQFYLKITEGKSRWPEQTSVQAAASNSERSSASELPPEAQSTARESAPELDPQAPVVAEGSASASAAPRSLVDEQRLLARANALLRQADISGARPLLEHAVDRGSARAAFMLAETYDARVLQSWRARGIPGDLTKARELYERAQAGGIEDAKERIKMLK